VDGANEPETGLIETKKSFPLTVGALVLGDELTILPDGTNWSQEQHEAKWWQRFGAVWEAPEGETGLP